MTSVINVWAGVHFSTSPELNTMHHTKSETIRPPDLWPLEVNIYLSRCGEHLGWVLQGRQVSRCDGSPGVYTLWM